MADHPIEPAVWAGEASTPLLETTIGALLRQQASRYPDHAALVWAEGEGFGRLDYATLLARAEQVAFWLISQGQPGDRVAIWSRNSVDWIVLEYGCALAGMVVAAWNTAWTDPEVEHARDLTEPGIVFAGPDNRGVDLFPRARILAARRKVFHIDELEALTYAAPPVTLPAVTPGAPFLIQFTSGTTGRAKGALLSHRAALNGAWVRASAYGCGPDDVWLNPVPMHHIGGAVHLVLGAMTVGSCYIVAQRFEPVEFLRLMITCGATRIGGVPTMLLAVLDAHDGDTSAFKVRSIGAGGADVPRSLIERIERDFNAPVLNTYAQSECPMIAAGSPRDSVEARATTVGQPLPHVEVKICRPDTGATLGFGDIGEICVRSPLVMDGYYDMPQATAAAFDAEGFLRTGDLGSLDAGGYLRIQGRARDLIIRGGENIYPAEVEDALLQHPEVAGVGVIGLPDERWGQQVAAVVLLAADASSSAADLEAFVAARVAHFKVPRFWRFVDALPLTASGKVRKVELVALFRE